MSEENKDDSFEFVNEKIKDKPLGKKRIARSLVLTGVCAALFAVIASLIFIAMTSQARRDEEELAEHISEDEPAREDYLSQGEAESLIEEKVKNEVDLRMQNIEVSELQAQQNKLYEIGAAQDAALVTVTGVSGGTDWFNTAYEQEGQGSGIISSADEKGILIATQNTLVASAQDINVKFCDGATASGYMLGHDSNTNLAVISVDAKDISDETLESVHCVSFGISGSLKRGNIVVAIGSPLGTNGSILIGNITSVDNQITTVDRDVSVFTTDIVGSKAGNGVLLNTDGEVIGFIMQEFSASGAENTLTAVPVYELQDILEELSKGMQLPYLGMKLSTVTQELSEKYNMPEGVYVVSTEMDSPAMQAGIQSGDILIEINGEKLNSVSGYEMVLKKFSIGDEVSITLKRQGAGGEYVAVESAAIVGEGK